MEAEPSPNDIRYPVYIGETLVYMYAPDYYLYLAALTHRLDNEV